MSESVASLAFENLPQTGRVYIHNSNGGRLVVGSVSYNKYCVNCQGSGETNLLKLRCHQCEGRGYLHGSVICHRPKDEQHKDNDLIWTLDDFLASFAPQPLTFIEDLFK